MIEGANNSPGRKKYRKGTEEEEDARLLSGPCQTAKGGLVALL